MKCENCGKEHDGKYGSGRFCCAKCARGFSTKFITEEGRKKQKEALNDKENRKKARDSMLKNNENYELDENGNWNKIKKSKKKEKYQDNTNICINKSTKKHRHSLVTGKIGELATAQKFANHGYNIFVPLVDISGVDMIVEKDDGLKKIQVKTSSQSSGDDQRSTEFSLYTNAMCIKQGKATNNKKIYSTDQVDYFALYSEIDKDVYLLENDGKTKSITIRNSIDPSNLTTKGKNLERLHMAEDYQIDKVLNDIDNKIHQSDIIEIDDFIEKDSE